MDRDEDKVRGNRIRLALVKGIVFGILLLGMLFLTSYWLRPFGVDGPMCAVDAFHELEEDSVQVLIYGSSRAWRGLDPLPMYEQFGIAAYNYAGNWQKINTTSLYLHDSLKTQHPKVVLIEAKNVGLALWNKDLNGEIYYSKSLPPSREKLTFLTQCFRYKPERYISYILPVLACHENWQTILNGEGRESRSTEDYLMSLGFVRTENVYQNTIGNYLDFEQKELPDRTRQILEELVQTCHANGVKVVFYLAPAKTEYHYRVAMQRFCEQYGCFWVDGYEKMEQIGIDPETDFNDARHLNVSGAQKMAIYLGGYLKERFDLEDMRKVPGNYWESVCRNRMDHYA